MAVTGNQVFSIALTLIDEVNTTGAIDKSDLTLPTKALNFLTILQTEMKPNAAASEVVLKSLDDQLSLSDWQCLAVLPYGLAAMLAMQDAPAAANFFQQKFEENKRKKRAVIGPIVAADQGSTAAPSTPSGDFDGGSFDEPTTDIDGGSFGDTDSGDIDGGSF
jgi:hypothetical protein